MARSNPITSAMRYHILDLLTRRHEFGAYQFRGEIRHHLVERAGMDGATVDAKLQKLLWSMSDREGIIDKYGEKGRYYYSLEKQDTDPADADNIDREADLRAEADRRGAEKTGFGAGCDIVFERVKMNEGITTDQLTASGAGGLDDVEIDEAVGDLADEGLIEWHDGWYVAKRDAKARPHFDELLQTETHAMDEHYADNCDAERIRLQADIENMKAKLALQETADEWNALMDQVGE